MSLHLGNLTPRVRRDELERVFRRFGRCNVQVKDRYGFVVYDYPINAERALKTLGGKRVCGEAITISWSTRQPKPVQKYPRSGRPYKPLRERQSGREDRVSQKFGSGGRRDYGRGFKQVNGNGGGLDSADQVVGETLHTFADEFPNEGGDAETRPIEDDRWGAEDGDHSKENGLGNGFDFDRYDPYYIDIRKEQGEGDNATDLVAARKSEELKGVEQVNQASLRPYNDGKSQTTCYICGEVGHKMRKCPQELNQLTSRYQGRLHKREAESSRSRNRQKMKDRVSPRSRACHRGLREDFGEKKRNRNEHQSPDKHRSKKPRGPISTSMYSDYTSSGSRSQSRSLRPLSGSHSHLRSRSIESQKNSPPKSRSRSVSHQSRHRSPRSRLMSKSSSHTSLPLSVSSGQPLTSFPNKEQRDQKDDFLNTASPEMKEVVNGEERAVNSELEAITVTENENANAAASFKFQGDVNDRNHQNTENMLDHPLIKSSSEARDFGIPQADNGDRRAEVSTLQSSTTVREFENSDAFMENPLVPAKNSEPQVSETPVNANSTNISPGEIFMVLKHYGLEHPGDNEKDLPVETFFGSARLWPWEIIYYRRLKKGPISTENYARRMSQNREFGIVDKYIRSSSGWVELVKEDT